MSEGTSLHRRTLRKIIFASKIYHGSDLGLKIYTSDISDILKSLSSNMTPEHQEIILTKVVDIGEVSIYEKKCEVFINHPNIVFNLPTIEILFHQEEKMKNNFHTITEDDYDFNHVNDLCQKEYCLPLESQAFFSIFIYYNNAINFLVDK
jgi:hypothetical protein